MQAASKLLLALARAVHEMYLHHIPPIIQIFF
jgi:hypothetical protein